MKPLFFIPLVITGVVIIITFFVQFYHYVHLSTKEATTVQPILYLGISVIIILSVGILMIWKKFIDMKVEMHHLKSQELPRSVEKTTESSTYASTDLELLQTKLNNVEKIGKRTTYAISVTSLVVVAILSFYMYEHFYEPNLVLTSGKYIIEDMNGQQVDAQVAWYATKEEPFHVYIINSNLLSPEKIETLKNPILSEETVEIPNSVVKKNPPQEKTVYYKGWKGALMKANEKNTSLIIPINFKIEESDKQLGEIMIILSKDRPDNIHSNTKSIVDANNHQILKSIITVYDVENLNEVELSAIIRHEFGHALGLYPSGTKDNLTYHVYEPPYAYVSECNIDDLVSLYGGDLNQTPCDD
ncbi:matrixin family metalloprotease [Candidatus Nitrosotenuis sp. DW1]|uniref:matrixin family metalloprotease n=1 Tax=Candidatus Nitrosotenuis sp. DW1 TaxID=2259672 RepID=UPI0015C7217F|nr:matrixin family metalloprotease [Candidatus Nitrosotenuis sp. DW1]